MHHVQINESFNELALLGCRAMLAKAVRAAEQEMRLERTQGSLLSPPLLVTLPPPHLRTTLTHITRVNSGRVEAELDEDGKQESKAQPLDDMQRGTASWRQQVTAQNCTLPSPAHHRDHLRLPST